MIFNPMNKFIYILLLFVIVSCDKDDNEKVYNLSNVEKEAFPYSNDNNYMFKNNNGREINFSCTVSTGYYKYSGFSNGDSYKSQYIIADLISSDELKFQFEFSKGQDYGNNLGYLKVSQKLSYKNDFVQNYLYEENRINNTESFYQEFFYHKELKISDKTFNSVLYVIQYRKKSITKDGINYIIAEKTFDIYSSKTKGLIAFRTPQDTSLYILQEK